MAFAYIYIALTVFAGLVLLGLILGAPWGDFTLGGRYPGVVPPKIRALAGVQIIVLILFALIVVVKSRMALLHYYPIADKGIWVVVVFFALGTLANMSSPSMKERAVMGPANILALISTLAVAMF